MKYTKLVRRGKRSQGEKVRLLFYLPKSIVFSIILSLCQEKLCSSAGWATLLPTRYLAVR